MILISETIAKKAKRRIKHHSKISLQPSPIYFLCIYIFRTAMIFFFYCSFLTGIISGFLGEFIALSQYFLDAFSRSLILKPISIFLHFFYFKKLRFFFFLIFITIVLLLFKAFFKGKGAIVSTMSVRVNLLLQFKLFRSGFLLISCGMDLRFVSGKNFLDHFLCQSQSKNT